MPTAPPAATSNTLTITCRQLHDLLKPVLPFGDSSGFAQLDTILIQYTGAGSNYLTASATDRYRLAIKRVQVLPEPADGEEVAAPLADPFAVVIKREEAKQILSLFKPSRRGLIRQPKLTIGVTAGDEASWGHLVVEAVPDAGTEPHTLAQIQVGTASHDPASYPNLFSLAAGQIARVPDAMDTTGPGVVGLNIRYLADLYAAAQYSESGLHAPAAHVVLTLLPDPTRGVVAQVGPDFLAVIMPRNLTVGASQPEHVHVAAGWKQLADDLSEQHKALRSATHPAIEAKAAPEADAV